MVKEFCRKAILGAFVQGYFHNLRGTLQGLFLPLQRVQLNPSKYLTPEGMALFEKLWASTEKLNRQLTIALEEIENASEGPWDLYEIMNRELLFWEADLRFKHKVKKTLTKAADVKVRMPYNLLLGTLCLVEAELYQRLPEGTELEIKVGTNGSPCITFSWQEVLPAEIFQPLEEAMTKVSSLISSFASLKLDLQSVTLCFQS